ncbi:MAG: hemerythrin domain-containing protein [Sulfuriflexus sp.]|nr:hemerythrin domain-containing protein [Sulfuriflexus sp.]
MNDNSNWLVHDHDRYDNALTECEIAADMGEWKNVTVLFNAFIEDLQLHMRLEDEVLYPFFVKEVGDSDGEISDLSEEHEEITRLLSDLLYIVKSNDFDHFLDSLEPLHEILNEHNEHEEAVFRCVENEDILSHRDEIMAQFNIDAKGQQTK